MLRLFNKIFVHKDSSYEHLENGGLSECVQSNYFTENDNYIDSYENALIPAPERVTRHVGNFSNLKMLIIADLHGHFRNYEKELKIYLKLIMITRMTSMMDLWVSPNIYTKIRLLSAFMDTFMKTKAIHCKMEQPYFPATEFNLLL